MSAQELEHLVAQYQANKDTMSEQLKAEMERALWALAPAEEKKTIERRTWIFNKLGVDKWTTENRSSILGCGEAAEPLWERIESKQLLVSTAAKIAREAKKGVCKGLSLEKAIDEALKHYDQLPVVSLINGIPSRKSRPRGDMKLENMGAAIKAEAEEGPRDLFENIRTAAGKYIATRLQGLDQAAASKLATHFERDLKILIEEFRRKVEVVRGREKNTVAVVSEALSRSKVAEACQTLCIPAPRFGQPVDMVLAGRKKRQLAGLYHPDTHGGSNDTVEQYDAVLKAYALLEEYAEQQQPKAPNSGEEKKDGSPNQQGDPHD
jgi:hypothetical protein